MEAKIYEDVRPLPAEYPMKGGGGNMLAMKERGELSTIYGIGKPIMVYEVFLLQVAPPAILPNKKEIGARERLPSDESFGSWAWSFSDEKAAWERYRAIENGDYITPKIAYLWQKNNDKALEKLMSIEIKKGMKFGEETNVYHLIHALNEENLVSLKKYPKSISIEHTQVENEKAEYGYDKFYVIS